MKHSEGFLKLVNDAKSRIREVTVDETRQRMLSDNGVRLIDVREDNEWEAGHAAGSAHLGKGIIERDIEAEVPDKATEVILYCGGGYRSASPPTSSNRWATPTSSPWPAAGRRGKTPARRLRLTLRIFFSRSLLKLLR